ncbi:UDP-N-acetylmuramate--L-alanine ligase [Actinomyces vulturis]|uniref:UDP-N-acetylmuramate--L-alanine ligase n=1 Tax=Actinomyces vulturis TaxID=1857645 RepID=UPI00082A5FC0|nr:UDP-N-acetylmuramate--L-alanine ligase [Actinomyces vulturis]
MTTTSSLAGRHFFLLGIGGAGMSVVAQLLASQGATVAGADAADSPTCQALRDQSIPVLIGHDPADLPEEATVVISTAIKETNPQLVVARSRGQEILHRSEALALAAREQAFVAVAGAHGKTTTSGMLAQALTAAGADPSFAVGGVVSALGTGAHMGNGGVFVAEADESDRSFLNYRPAIEIVTNVEPDHLDTYGSTENFEAAFVDFAHRLTPDGTLIICSDDPGARRVAEKAITDGLHVITYGQGPGIVAQGEGIAELRSPHAQLVIRDRQPGTTRATITMTVPASAAWLGEPLVCGLSVDITLAMPGDHVVLNAASAWLAGVLIGVEPQVMAQSLGTFTGTGRRFELRGEAAGVRVMDDYAHHPTEVAALVTSALPVARERGGRLILAFQPHLFSRTENFAERFAQALSGAHAVVLADIYPARETQEQFPHVTSAIIAQHMNPESVTLVGDLANVAPAIVDLAQANDLVITVGAGSITQAGPQILSILQERA